MSMSAETAAKHKNDPAVVCCRTEAGVLLTADHLEDPAIFPDLVDSGLLKLDNSVLTVGQVIGAKLVKTIDSLTPITADTVEGVKSTEESAPAVEAKAEATQTDSISTAAAAPIEGGVACASGGVLKIHIGEGKDINLQIPMGGYTTGAPVASEAISIEAAPSVVGKVEAVETVKVEDIVKRTLKVMEFPVKEVKLGDETKFEDYVLTIRESLVTDALAADPLVKSINIDIITPDNHNIYTDTMMDVSPIATKVEGSIGDGITHEMTGVVAMLTGIDESGKQISDANASNGILAENVAWGRPGCPDIDDIIIRVHAVIKDGTRMERPGPYAAHKAMDVIVQEIREVLKKVPADKAKAVRALNEVQRKGRPRVVIVKEIMGQGAMHDNLILPVEPAGVLGGRPNVDLGNVPVVLSPNEVFDGGIHALTCITPPTKETTRHYYREPLIKRVAEDEEFDLIGVIFVGSPQANVEKFYVSERLGRLIEALAVDGAIVTTEGYGNNHIDFCSHIEQIGMRGIPVVGVSWCAVQGALVVGNKYMDAMVELNKSEGGVECDILENNTITDGDALRAVAMLKNKMMGVDIKPAERQWENEVLNNNMELAKKSHKIEG